MGRTKKIVLLTTQLDSHTQYRYYASIMRLFKDVLTAHVLCRRLRMNTTKNGYSGKYKSIIRSNATRKTCVKKSKLIESHLLWLNFQLKQQYLIDLFDYKF